MKKGFTLMELLAIIAIIGLLAILLIPNVIRIYNAGVERVMKVQEGTVLTASNLLINDYCKGEIDDMYKCPEEYQIEENDQRYVCLNDLYDSKYIENVKYKNQECEGMVVYDKNTNGKYSNGKTYLYCGKDNNGNYSYKTDDSVSIKPDCIGGIKTALFDTGTNVNIKMKQLANLNVSGITVSYSDTNITAILRSNTEPSSANKEAKNIVSLSTSPQPIYMWYSNGTIYWWSVDRTPALNSDASNMFGRLSNLVNISGLSRFDTSDVENMSSMFLYDYKISNLNALSNWDVSNVTTMQSMFYQNTGLASLEGLRNWNVSSVTNMRTMFYQNTSLKTLDGLEKWNVSNVKTMLAMFTGQTNAQMKITTLSALRNWNTSNVTDMSAMFQMATSLTTLEGLENWNVSNVENMSYMFCGVTQAPMKLTTLSAISNWDTSNVTDMQSMFKTNADLISLEGLENWDVSKVQNMTSMFQYNTSLITADLSKWNTKELNDTNYMFNGDSELKTIYASSKFTTNKITTSTSMFNDCLSLVGGKNTAYDSSFIDKTYARLDDPDNDLPGYFTYKSSN